MAPILMEADSSIRSSNCSTANRRGAWRRLAARPGLERDFRGMTQSEAHGSGLLLEGGLRHEGSRRSRRGDRAPGEGRSLIGYGWDGPPLPAYVPAIQ